MVLVEDHEIPVGRGATVPRLDHPVLLAKEILERAEVDQRAILVSHGRVAGIGLRKVLPPIEINMREQVRLPGILDRRLESDDQNLIAPNCLASW